MQMQYYDPQFYICSEKMPFSIRIEINMKSEIDGTALRKAVDFAYKRFPYFKKRVINTGEEYVTEDNPRPVAVLNSEENFTLLSEEVNGQLTYVTYFGKRINVCCTHVYTDGGGVYPLIKTLLFYYVSEKEKVSLSTNGIELADGTPYPDETGEPVEGKLLSNAKPFYERKKTDYFELNDGCDLKEGGRVFRLKIRQKELMGLSFLSDGSPNALISALMAKAVWAVNPNVKKDLLSAVSFNMRSGLKGTRYSGLLSDYLPVVYSAKMKDFELKKICTCTRAMLTLLSQPENVIYRLRERKENFEKLKAVKGVEEKKRIMGEKALKDSTANTFSVSYVGKQSFGDLESYLDTIYNTTDGSTAGRIFLEITSVGEYFNIAFLQGFNSEVYYKAFLEQLENYGIVYEEDYETPLAPIKISLP